LNYQLLNEDKPVLVFLHEALGSIIQWKQFPFQLCENLSLTGLIIERTGHGKSSELQAERNEKYLHSYANESLQVLETCLAKNQKYILVGHSDGGTIALLIGKSNPESLVGIVTLAAHTFVEEETLVGIQPAVDAFEKGKLDGLYRIHGDKTKQLFYAWANTWRADFFRNWDIRQEIKTIRQPIFALQGSQDQYGTVEQLKSIQEIETAIEVLEVPNCGHIPHIEKTEETIRLISKWMKNQTF
jgi:pimeloyl-ACP methyl ester carboxylesterase